MGAAADGRKDAGLRLRWRMGLRVAALLTEMSVRDAAKAAAETYAIPKGRAYEIALRVKQGGGAPTDE